MASTNYLVQHVEEPLDVLFRVVEVGRDAHARAPHADEDVLGAEPGGEVLRGFRAEPQARSCAALASASGSSRYRVLLPLCSTTVRQPSDGLGDVFDPPVEDLAQRLGRHREQDEVAPLADVVAPGAWLEGVLVLHEPREVLAAAAVDPVVLDGLASRYSSPTYMNPTP